MLASCRIRSNAPESAGAAREAATREAARRATSPIGRKRGAPSGSGQRGSEDRWERRCAPMAQPGGAENKASARGLIPRLIPGPGSNRSSNPGPNLRRIKRLLLFSAIRWWRWAESNRRPKALHPRHYMLSSSLDLAPEQHDVRSASRDQPA